MKIPHSFFILFIGLTFMNINCMNSTNKPNFQPEVQGHRGCRGLYPENTIPGFQHALEIGVKTLEMDVVISRDDQVVVSHEPFFNHEISTHPDGRPVTEEEERDLNMYQMDYEEIIKFDVGIKPHPRFENQQKVAAYKPLLSEVFALGQQWAELNDDTIFYNIEIKRVEGKDGVNHPDYRTFTDLVIAAIEKAGLKSVVTIQSFDLEVLRYLNEAYPDWQTVFLVENIWGVERNIDKLGHYPDIYSPNYKLLSAQAIEYCHKHQMKVIPWTVNEAEDMVQLMQMGVDGIITDYPDVLIAEINKKNTHANH